MTIKIVESIPFGEITDADLDYVIRSSGAGFPPSESRVWGRDGGAWRLVPISWLGTIGAIQRGLEHLLSKAQVADFAERDPEYFSELMSYRDWDPT